MIGGAVRAGKAFVEIVLYDKQLKRGLAMVQVNMRRFGQQLSSIGRTAAAFSVPIVAGLATTVKAASDAEEYMNRFNAVFGKLSGSAGKFADGLAKSVGRSGVEIKNALSGFQSFFVGLGAGNKDAATLSQELTKLAIDFASFNNLADEEAVLKFMAGISGEVEPLKRFGVVLTEARVNAKLLEQGFSGGSKKATEYQKALARFDILKEVLGQQGAIGDAERTIGSFANQLKVLGASTYEARTRIGQLLVPELVKFVGWLADAADGVKALADRNKELGKSLTDLAAKVALVTASVWALGKAIAILPALIALITSGGWVSAAIVGIGIVTASFVDWKKAVDEVRTALDGIGELIKQGKWEEAGELAGLAFKKGFISAVESAVDEIQERNKGWLSFGPAGTGIGLLGSAVQKLREQTDELNRSIDELKKTATAPEMRDGMSVATEAFGAYAGRFMEDPLNTSGWREQMEFWKGADGVVTALIKKVSGLKEASSSIPESVTKQYEMLTNPLPGSTWGRVLGELRAQWMDITEAARQYREEVSKATDIFERTRTPVERAKLEIEKINESFQKGFISQQTRDRAIDLVKEDLTSQLELPKLSGFSRGTLVGGFRAGQVFEGDTSSARTMTALAKKQLDELIKLNKQAKEAGLLFQ